MAATNPYTSFTITQPFLGAPLQFQPALGTNELEELIDAFVTGSARKQDKFSEVTLDFYNNATVDLNTGALTRTYNVFPSHWISNAFEQSPTQSQSSGCSPMYTPSPGSSATFGDSAYGSISMTPPTRSRGARVTKKAKKDTPKAAEARLPGFSIMTKDGIDVTNSAGRGTKTKEQREHAHLMRIMKACDSCKKKKIRCDPSHRRSHNDMSRTSTSTTRTSSSGRLDLSPAASAPSLSREATQASQNSLPSFSPSNPIDDFVLFPEDSSSWNADMSFPELETQDLGQFSFDINDIDLTDYPSMTLDHSFDFSFDRQPSSSLLDNHFGYTPSTNDQCGLDQWAEPEGSMPVSHTRPHPAGPSNDSGQLDANWQSSFLQAESLISPRTTTFADNYWPDTLVDHPQILQNPAVNSSPLLSDSPDWSLFGSTIVADSAPPGDGTANNGLSQASDPRRSRKRRAVDEQASSGTSEQLKQARPELLARSINVSQEISRLQNSAQIVSKSLRSIRRAPAEYTELGIDLQQLEGTLARLSSSQHAETILSDSSMAMIESVRTQLEVLSSRSERSRSSGGRRHKLGADLRPDHARELQVAARRLVRSLCATINTVEALNTGTNSPMDNQPMLTSSRNLQLQVSSSESHDHERRSQAFSTRVQMGDSTSWPGSRSSSSAIETTEAVLQRTNGNVETLDIYVDADGVRSPTTNERNSVAAAALTVRDVSRCSMLLKSKLGDLPARSVEESRLIERSEQSRGGLLALVGSNSGQTHARTDLHEEQTGRLATVEQVRADNMMPSPIADRTVWQSVDATLATTTQFSVVAALTVIGSLALAANISSSGLNISSRLPYLIPLLALSLLVPGQHRPSTALIAGAFFLASSLSEIQDLRTNCTEWIGNDTFSAVAKLLLVATLVSSELLSSLNLSFIAVTAMKYFFGTQYACSSRNGIRVSKGKFSGDAEGSYASWLGMMDMLSPVVAA